MNRKIAAIVITGLCFLALGFLLLADGASTSLPFHATLWGAAGTAVLVYWPRKSKLQLLSLCWLCILLYSIAAIFLVDCSEPVIEDAYMPNITGMFILMAIPFLMALLPIPVLLLRSAYRDHMRTVLEEAVLAATDSLQGPAPGAMDKALHLLRKGIPAHYIPDAIVQRDEDNFEALGTPDPEAVANELKLIPMLAAAGASISQVALDSAKYNCPPAVQEALKQLPVA